MPTPTARTSLAALAVLASVGPAFGQLNKPPVTITDVRVGLPPGRYVAERDANREIARELGRRLKGGTAAR